MLTFSLTWRKQNQRYTPSITTTTLASHLAPTETLQPLRRSCKMDHLEKLTSLPDTNESTAKYQMNLKTISSLGRRILILADRLTGGGGGVPNFPICIVSLEISLLFLVNLFHFFSTILETKIILGSAVAVERIFSGGRDTISMRRASLHSDTIRTLMLVKHRLRLARVATVTGINRALWYYYTTSWWSCYLTEQCYIIPYTV